MSFASLDPVLVFALHGGAALLFLSAAAHKLRDLAAFRAALAGYRLLPARALGAGAVGLAAAEVGVGTAWLVPGLAPAACAAGVALLALYAAAVALNLARGRSAIDCGCGGPGGPRPLGTGLIARNAVLAGLLLCAALPASARPLVWLDAVSSIGLLVALALVHAAADVALANAARLREWEAPSWSTR